MKIERTEVIYRIVIKDEDDLDLTRAEAQKVLAGLRRDLGFILRPSPKRKQR